MRTWQASFIPASLIPVALFGIVSCEAPETGLADDRLPAEALAAFQDHVRTLGQGDLICPAEAIEAAPRVSIDINDDGIADYALETARLRCSASEGYAPQAFFCGGRICAFPAIVSAPEGWRVISVMSGNAIEAVAHYRQGRFRVFQHDFGDPSGNRVVIREYTWQDDHLARVSEYDRIARR